MTVHIRVKEWRTVGPLDPASPLMGISLADAAARDAARALAGRRVLDVIELRDGISVRAYAYVGRVRLGDLVVTIEPKISAPELLELVRYAFGLRQLTLFERTPFATTGQLFQDLLVAQLVAEATSLASRGLSRTYVPRRDSLPTPRGRIDMGQLASHMPLRDPRLPCRYYARSSDHVLNRTLLAGLRLAGKIAEDADLRRSARRLVARLEDEIGTEPLTRQSLALAGMHVSRLTEAYSPSLALIELLYACQAVSMDGDSTTALSGFLFDMNRFFQALLFRFLNEHLDGLEVEGERRLHGMMRYVPGFNPRGRKSPAPRPDFVVKNGRRLVAILDAKYRDLWEHKLPRDMLYQLTIYALSQPRPTTAAILYPTVTSTAREAVVEVRDPLRQLSLGFVAVRPIIVAELLEAIRAGRCRQTTMLAQRYAFGEHCQPTAFVQNASSTAHAPSSTQ